MPTQVTPQFLQQHPDYFQKILLVAVCRSYQCYRTLREQLCPYEEWRKGRRPDFQNPAYNRLYRLVADYWEFWQNSLDGARDYQLRLQDLEELLRSEIMHGRVSSEDATQMYEQMQMDLELFEFDSSVLTQLSVHPMVVNWLNERSAYNLVDQIYQRRAIEPMTLEKLATYVSDQRKRHGTVQNNLVSAGTLMGGRFSMSLPFPTDLEDINYALGGGMEPETTTLVAGTNGGGKCLAKGTLVIMFDGSTKKVEDICVGDQLMGPDSKPRNVHSVARGREEMFNVIPKKGVTWGCNRSHILSLQAGGTTGPYTKGEVVNITVDEYLKKPIWWKNLFKLYRTGIELSSQSTPFDPYVVGLWLGNGSRQHACITVADDCPEIKSYLQEWAANHYMTIRKEPGSHCELFHFKKQTSGSGKNLLRQLAIFCQNDNQKYLPDCYWNNNRAVRLQVLAGLLDTDGYYHHGHYEIVSVYPALAERIVYLARSLGYAAYSRTKVGTIKALGFRGHYTRVTISGDFSDLPVRVARKKPAPRRQIKSVNRVGFKLQSIGEGDYYGFEIDGDRLFLLGDFTVTHNTILAMQWARHFAINGAKVVVVTTEQPPYQLLLRMICKHLEISLQEFREAQNFDHLSLAERRRQTVSQPIIPDRIWQAYQEPLQQLYQMVWGNLYFLDWTRESLSVYKSFDLEMEKIEATGWDPDVVVFDWIGGGVDSPREGAKMGLEVRHLYKEAVDCLVTHGKRHRRVMIAMAQLNKDQVGNTHQVTMRHLAEAKNMTDNVQNFLGISSMSSNRLTDTTNNVTVNRSRMQFINVDKARKGPKGLVKVDADFRVQTFRNWRQT